MASPTQWTWVWASSRSWWWTGKPGLLQSMGLQRIRHDLATELNWTSHSATVSFFPTTLAFCHVFLCFSRPALPYCLPDPSYPLVPNSTSQKFPLSRIICKCQVLMSKEITQFLPAIWEVKVRGCPGPLRDLYKLRTLSEAGAALTHTHAHTHRTKHKTTNHANKQTRGRQERKAELWCCVRAAC